MATFKKGIQWQDHPRRWVKKQHDIFSHNELWLLRRAFLRDDVGPKYTNMDDFVKVALERYAGDPVVARLQAEQGQAIAKARAEAEAHAAAKATEVTDAAQATSDGNGGDIKDTIRKSEKNEGGTTSNPGPQTNGIVNPETKESSDKPE